MKHSYARKQAKGKTVTNEEGHKQVNQRTEKSSARPERHSDKTVNDLKQERQDCHQRELGGMGHQARQNLC